MPDAASETVIATWIYLEPEGEESFYPQVGGVPSSPAFQALYWRCVALFFATSARQNPAARHVLYTNAPGVPAVDGFDLAALLERLGVEVTTLPFTYEPPPGYYGAWRNQFYVFDCIGHLAATQADGAVAFLLDSDCFWIRPADAMAAATRTHGVLTYDVGLGEDEPQNGLTRRTMGALYAELGHPAAGVPPYLGGELFAATGAAAREVAARLRPLWDEMMARFADGRPKFNEEAHALSYVYHTLGLPAGTANPFVKRIWTTLFYAHDADAADYGLTVWHVPAEKRYGIRRLFREVKDPGAPLWTIPVGRPFAEHLGRYLGIPRRTPKKLALDLPVAVRDKLRSKLGRR